MADTYNFSLRMPMQLGETISELSNADRRPMNTQIIMLLEFALREKSRKRKKKGDDGLQ